MGLDNGIHCYKEDLLKPVPFFIKNQLDYPGKKELDLCYWRRWYELRDQIYNVLENPVSDSLWKPNKGYILIDSEIKRIIKILVKYLWYPYFKERENRNYNWEYRYCIFTNIQHIINLIWVLYYRKKHNLNVYFYDVY